MQINDIDETTFSLKKPKNAYDYDFGFSDMCFFKNKTIDGGEITKFCYLPNKYSGSKKIIKENTEWLYIRCKK